MSAPLSIPAGELVLVPCGLGHFSTLIDGPAAFTASYGWAVSPGYLEWPEALIVGREALMLDPDRAGWWSYLTIHRQDQCLIGFGGYKGLPTDGAVEIGYSIAPAYRRQGHGAAMVDGLVSHALADPRVSHVIAHTLPEINPSTHLLRRAGFRHTDTPVDPLQGPSWKWEYP